MLLSLQLCDARLFGHATPIVASRTQKCDVTCLRRRNKTARENEEKEPRRNNTKHRYILMTRVAYTKKKKEEGRRNSATDPNSSNCAVLPAPTLHDFSPVHAPPRDTTGFNQQPPTPIHCTHLQPRTTQRHRTQQQQTPSGSYPPRDLEWKRRTQASQVCSLCTVCVADVTWHLLHAGKHGAGRS